MRARRTRKSAPRHSCRATGASAPAGDRLATSAVASRAPRARLRARRGPSRRRRAARARRRARSRRAGRTAGAAAPDASSSRLARGVAVEPCERRAQPDQSSPTCTAYRSCVPVFGATTPIASVYTSRADAGRPWPAALVVDDDPALRMLCRVNLELEGFAVREAATRRRGARGARARSGRTSCSSTCTSGGEQTRRPARASCAPPGVPVALVTGSVDIDDYRDRRGRGAREAVRARRRSSRPRARLARVDAMSATSVLSPTEFEARLERYLFERSEEGRAVRVGEKEIVRAGRDRRAATPTSSAASSSTRCARPRSAAAGDERELLYRLRKTCESGLDLGASSPSARTSSRTGCSPTRVTFHGEEMPLRNAQAKLAVLPDVRRPRGARRRSRPRRARRSTTTGSSCCARARSSRPSSPASPTPVERNEEEKGISLRELSRGAEARRATTSTRRYERAARAAGSSGCSAPSATDVPSSYHTALHAPALAARVDLHEGPRDRDLPRRR